MRILILAIVTSTVLSVALSACGVKGPPLPPEGATNAQQTDKDGWNPQRGASPRPVPSPSAR